MYQREETIRVQELYEWEDNEIYQDLHVWEENVIGTPRGVQEVSQWEDGVRGQLDCED